MYPQKQGRPQQGGIDFAQPSFCPEQEQGFIEPSDTNEVWRSRDFSSVLSEHSSMVIVSRYFLVLKRVACKRGWQLLELWRCHCTNHFLSVNPPAARSRCKWHPRGYSWKDIGVSFGEYNYCYSEERLEHFQGWSSRMDPLFVPIFFGGGGGDAIDWSLGEQLLWASILSAKHRDPHFTGTA